MIRSFCMVDAIQALIVAIAVWPVGMYLVADAREVHLITPHSSEMVDTNQGFWEFDHPDGTVSAEDAELAMEVIRIYGNPIGDETIRVMWVPDEQIIHPTEMPSLNLLPQDKTKNENVLQVQTVWFFIGWTSFGAGMTSVGLFALWGLLTWRQRRKLKPMAEPETAPAPAAT